MQRWRARQTQVLGPAEGQEWARCLPLSAAPWLRGQGRGKWGRRKRRQPVPAPPPEHEVQENSGTFHCLWSVTKQIVPTAIGLLRRDGRGKPFAQYTSYEDCDWKPSAVLAWDTECGGAEVQSQYLLTRVQEVGSKSREKDSGGRRWALRIKRGRRS